MGVTKKLVGQAEELSPDGKDRGFQICWMTAGISASFIESP